MLVPVIVAIAGGLLYYVPQGKVSELGRILFFVGIFWLVALFSHGRIHFVGP